MPRKADPFEVPEPVGWRVPPVTAEMLPDGRVRLDQDREPIVGYPGWFTRATFVADAKLTDVRLTRLEIVHVDGLDAPMLQSQMLRHVQPDTMRRSMRVNLLRADFAVKGASKEPMRWDLLDRAVIPKSRGRGTDWTPFELARLADEYAKLAESVKNPLEQLAKSRNMAYKTARGLIARSRRAGLLDSTTRGRGGGALTTKGRRILQGGG